MSYSLNHRKSIDWTRCKWIRMSARQVAKNVSYTGGFIGMLASFAARALPAILTGPGRTPGPTLWWY